MLDHLNSTVGAPGTKRSVFLRCSRIGPPSFWFVPFVWPTLLEYDTTQHPHLIFSPWLVPFSARCSIHVFAGVSSIAFGAHRSNVGGR
jgi:hypothetical protein